MAEKLYNIILTGGVLEGHNREQVVTAFALKFKLDEAKAAATIDNAPVVIKAKADENTAKAFLGTLKKLGLQCKVELLVNAEALPVNEHEVHAISAESSEATDDTLVTSSTDTENTTPSLAEKPTKSSSVYEPENPPGLSFRIEGKPDYSFLTVQIPANETLKVEASAMATMDTHVKMKTKFKGGFGRLLTGENLFMNDFTAQNIPGEIGIAPGTPGDLSHQYLNGNTIFLQNSAYVASTSGVIIETKWQGLVKGFFSGENLFLIRCSGQGDLWFNTYGAIIEIDVTDDYVVDTGNIVAFTEGLEYTITKVGGYKSLFFSGEGFVCRFSGTGKVWIQTRSAQAFRMWAHFYRPVKSA